MELVAVVAGIACGLVAAWLPMHQLRAPGKKSMGKALVASGVAFALIQAVMLATLAYNRSLVAYVGISATFTFLALVVVAVLRTPRE